MMAKNSLQEIAGIIVGKHGLSQQNAEAFVNSFFDLINEGLHSEKIVKVKGLGTFKVIDVRERESVNVNTGERVLIESHAKITFTADPVMRDLVNKPFAQFETVVLNDGVELEDMAKVQAPDDSDLKDSNDYEGDSETINDDMDETASYENKAESQNFIDDEYELSQQKQCVSDERFDVDDDSEETLSSESIENIDIYNGDVDSGNDYLEQGTDCVDNGDIVNNSTCDYLNSEDRQSLDNDILEGDQRSGTKNGETGRLTSNTTVEQFVATGCIDGTSDVYDGEEVGNVSGMAWYYWILIMLIVAVFAFWCGCYWEKYNAKPLIKYVTVKQAIIPVDSGVVDTIVRNDSVMVADNKLKQNTNDSVNNIRKNVTDKSEEQNDTPILTSSTIAEKQNLRNAMNVVRTGAYRIVGTDCIVTVKKGETLKKISKFYLGEGMECYVMVHNGITDIKEGMRLKIPKLVNKRKQ